jgi:hypothetical protein
VSALVQSAVAAGSNFVTLPGAPTAGNLLIVACETPDGGDNGSAVFPSPGAGWVQVGFALHPYYQAHPSFGGRGRLYYRIAVGGDIAGPYALGGGASSGVMAEFSTALTTFQAAAAAFLDAQSSAAVSLASGPVGVALVIGGVSTRLNTGTLTPSAGVNVIPAGGVLPGSSVGHDEAGILWKDGTGGAVTLGGTQSGITQDGYCWGMQIAAFGLPAAGSFPGEPGGGVW